MYWKEEEYMQDSGGKARRRQTPTKINLREIGWGVMDGIHVVSDRDQ
jgi:hypothetical protein